ncbi:MAG: PAS domain S-box protein [Candidatus Competibacteraceae bacterium]
MSGVEMRSGKAAAFYENAEIVRKVFEHSNDAIFVIDPEQDRILDANPKTCSLLGYSHEELLATPISAIHPQEMPELMAFARSVFNEGAGWTDRLTCLTKVGVRIPAEFSASATTIDDQRCLIVLARTVHRQGDQILRDIFAETAAVTGDAFFRSLVRHLAAALGVRYALIAARAPQPNQGQILALWSDQGLSGNFAHDLAATPCEAVLAGQIVHHPRDLRILFPVGKRELYPHAVSYLGFPLRDSQGQVLGHLAVMDDQPMPAVPLEMSVFRIFAERARAELERGRMEAILRQSEERFRTLARISPSIIFRADAAGDMFYVNERWSEWTGRRDEEVLGYGWAQAVHPEDRECTLAAWRQVVARRQPLSIQFRVLRADGSMVWVTGQAEPEWDETGKVLSYVGAFTDISAQKDTERQLLVAKHLAEAANRAKTDFLANLSHELRTPLNGILGYAQLLKPAENLTDAQRDALAVIQQSGEHLLSLINDLLDLSKIEAQRLEPASHDFQFREFLRFLVETLQVRAAGKGIVFAYEPVTDLPVGVRGDEKRLRQILVNLLGNAVKFTDRGSVHFRVGRRGEQMWFEIIDTGIGIPADQLETIFQPFQQVDRGSRTFEGTGLGLAICRRLVEALDGRLTVNSTLGEGSRFRLELTLPEVPAFQNSAPAAARPDAVKSSGNPLAAPSPTELDALQNLVAIGDIRGILEAAARIGQGDERLLPFARRLREFAKTFEINKIRELLGDLSDR